MYTLYVILIYIMKDVDTYHISTDLKITQVTRLNEKWTFLLSNLSLRILRMLYKVTKVSIQLNPKTKTAG
jgi:hypothetical protein